MNGDKKLKINIQFFAQNKYSQNQTSTPAFDILTTWQKLTTCKICVTNAIVTLLYFSGIPSENNMVLEAANVWFSICQ